MVSTHRCFEIRGVGFPKWIDGLVINPVMAFVPFGNGLQGFVYVCIHKQGLQFAVVTHFFNHQVAGFGLKWIFGEYGIHKILFIQIALINRPKIKKANYSNGDECYILAQFVPQRKKQYASTNSYIK